MSDGQGDAPDTAAAVLPKGIVSEDSSDAAFQAAVDTEIVAMGQIVSAKVMAAPRFTSSSSERAIGTRYYPLLLATFQKCHKAVQFTIQEDVGFGVVLHTADQGDPEGDKIDWAVIRRTLRFDWSQPRELLIETQELAEEARRWLRIPGERRDLLGQLYNVMTQIGATIGRENRLCKPDQDEGSNPSPRIGQDVAIIRRQLDAARARFRADVERDAQTKYAYGMAIGAIVTLAGWGILAWILAEHHTRIVNAVGLAAGAIGACVSVLERMTRGKLDINAQSGEKTLMAFGALRPVVGAIFGFLVYLIIRAGLVSVLTLPTGHAAALAYVSVFAFAAGFNERFAQDVLASASTARNDY